MLENTYLERKKGKPEAESAAALKREGLDIVQSASGALWTDYNLHDPGVTILEQLCYALTDLIYRTRFDTADLLCDAAGTLDYQKLALFPPEEIYPSQAITTEDYRKIIFDAIPEIDDLWVRCDAEQEGSPQGNYTIYIKLNEVLVENDDTKKHLAIIDKVKTLYAANRNLCENLQTVSIIPPRYYSLHGAIDLDEANALPEFLAELYYRCSRIITPGLPFQAYDHALREKPLETVFTGPQTQHVYIEDTEEENTWESVTLAEMIGEVEQIKGLRFIERLWFEDAQGNKTDSIAYDPQLDFVPCLKIPRDQAESGIQLKVKGRVYGVSVKEMKTEYLRRCAEDQALRNAKPHLPDLIPLPKGEAQDLSDYHSIQHHFPAIYGINAYGLPASETALRKAQAKQLKAYLLPYEQIMANFLQNLSALPRLFSLDAELNQSYFSQVLKDEVIPDIEEIYRGNTDKINSVLGRIVKLYDPYLDRRGRVLDYLLALYGEDFSQNTLQAYHEDDNPSLLRHENMHNKIHFLKNRVDISRNRAAAFNDRAISWNTENTAGLKKKVSLLLGMRYLQNRSLIDNFIEKGLELLSDEQYKTVKEGTLALEYVDLEEIQDRIDHQFLEVPPRKSAHLNEGRLFDRIVFLKHNTISESILRQGIHLNRYRVGSTGNGSRFQLVFNAGGDKRWEYLGSFPSMENAVAVANDLHQFLIQLNLESEGMHLLEHLLLKAKGERPHENVPDDFYPFRISVLFPAWTSRFHDKAFRQRAEDTVRLNAPAHLHIAFYWLAFKQMNVFEVGYKRWLDQKWLIQKNGNEQHTTTLDNAAKDLIDFLISNRIPD